MKIRTSILMAALLLTASRVSALPITLSFASSLLAAQPGATVTFTGTVTETGGTTTFLLGDVVSVAPPLVADDTPFLNNFPASLAGMQSITAAILSVSVPLATAPGIYNGTFAILGGEGTIASAPFAVNVGAATVPEPVTLSLLAVGAGALAARRRRPARPRR
jgi:hypothetical protein